MAAPVILDRRNRFRSRWRWELEFRLDGVELRLDGLELLLKGLGLWPDGLELLPDGLDLYPDRIGGMAGIPLSIWRGRCWLAVGSMNST